MRLIRNSSVRELISIEYGLAALAFLEMVGYYPGVLGAGTVGRWGLLWATVCLLLTRSGTHSLSLPLGLCGASIFVIYAIASLIWTPFPLDGILEAIILSTLCLAVMVGRSAPSLEFVFRATAIGIGFNSLIAIAQYFRFEPVVQLCCRPSGLFLNGNILAETAALVIVGMLAVAPGTRFITKMITLSACAPSLLLPMHRGSMIALAVAGMTLLLSTAIKGPRWRLYGGLLFVALGIPKALAVAYWLLYPTGSSAALMTEPLLSILPASVGERLQIWQATISGFTWFGHGAGSFRGLFPLYAATIDTMLLWPQHAHNDLLELIFEYGVFAAIPVAIAALCLFNRSPLRYVVLVFLVEGCFEFPLFMPATGFLAALSIGHCLREWDRARFAELFGRMAAFARRRRARPEQAAIGGAAVPV